MGKHQVHPLLSNCGNRTTCQNRYFHQKMKAKLYFLIDPTLSAPANERFEVLLKASSSLAFVIFKIIRNLKISQLYL